MSRVWRKALRLFPGTTNTDAGADESATGLTPKGPRPRGREFCRDAGRHHRSRRPMYLTTTHSRLPQALAELQRRLDGHVHVYEPLLLIHRRDLAASDPADRRREGALAVFQRRRLPGRGAAEGTHDHRERRSRGPV
jgi:hypothetical protein